MRWRTMQSSGLRTSAIASVCWSVETTSFGAARRCGGPYVASLSLLELHSPIPRLQFNTPLQLGPASSTLPSAAQVITLPVHADDILVLASDGLSDNLWDEEVLDEVVRFRRTFLT